MNLIFRIIRVWITSFFKARIDDHLAPSYLKFRVLPNDLDTNFHMNNGRYLTIMDLGRFDLILRNGLLKVMLQDKAIPVLSASQIRYRIPLHLWEAYDLETQIMCWDDKWFYIQQRFIIRSGEKAGVTAAVALLKGAFYSRKTKDTVPSSHLLRAVGADLNSPRFPDYIAQWVDAENALRDHTRKAL